jgi:manganese/zinc/iron transport system ATP- binding protein
MSMSSSKNGNSIFNVEELTVNYDKTAVLWDVTFSIPGGQLVGLIGPNGAGKSTLLKASIGLVRPLSGSVQFFGQSFERARSRVAYVPQRSSVDWDFPITALDLVLMGRYGSLGLFKWVSQKDREAAKKALDMVEMLPFAQRQISELSGGQQQRLFIARALLQEADLYLMDEPFAGIDMATEKMLVHLFRVLRGQGKTLLIVHHDLSAVQEYFDWLIMLNTCLIACGPVKEVYFDQNILRTYGRSTHLLDEAARLAQDKVTGLK